MVPRIAIPQPTSTDFDYNRRSWPMYARAVQQSGGEPVSLELGSPAALRSTVADCHGILLPGSPADVTPAKYGETADPLTEAADPAREACDDLLLEHADHFGKPVLGVCFGLQSLNVWRGGSLIQHLTPLPVNHAAGSRVAVAHAVLIAEASQLASLLDAEEASPDHGVLRLPVNTSHHQAVATPGHGLSVIARSAEDGVIEALETVTTLAGARHFVLGVQWHPERSFDISATSRQLFTTLVSEAAAWASTSAAPAVLPTLAAR